MLNFALGDLTVTLRHHRRNPIQISSQLQGRIVRYGRACGEDKLQLTQGQSREWSAADKTPAQLNAWLASLWESRRTERPSAERGSQDLLHDRTEPFMGRGSLCVTSPPWTCKVTHWTLLVSLLLLLSFMAPTASPTPIMEDRPNAEINSLAVPDPKNTEFVVEENIDMSVKSTWTSTYENVTLETHNDDELSDVLLRSERSPGASAKPKKHKKPGSRGKDKSGDGEAGCSRQSLRVRVRDLGLGYNSEEWITFFYCSGSCQKHRSNYDLTLTSLLKHKHITHSAHGRVSNHPCCRPTSYESVVFMDVTNTWQIVPNLSAANCSCVR